MPDKNYYMVVRNPRKPAEVWESSKAPILRKVCATAPKKLRVDTAGIYSPIIRKLATVRYVFWDTTLPKDARFITLIQRSSVKTLPAKIGKLLDKSADKINNGGAVINLGKASEVSKYIHRAEV